MKAQEIRDSLNAEEIPEHLWGGIIRYIIDGIRPGDFLCAIIRMDVEDAHRRVFPPTRTAIPKLTTWFLTEAPPSCCGSGEALETWLKLKAAERQAARSDQGKGE